MNLFYIVDPMNTSSAVKDSKVASHLPINSYL